MSREQIIARMTELKPMVDEYERLKDELVPLQEEWAKDNLSIEGRLKDYFDNIEERGKMLDWVPSEREYPLIRRWIEGRDIQRYRTIEFADYLCDQIYYIVNPEAKQEAIEEGSYDQEYFDQYLPLLVEIMEKKVAGFTMDW